MFRNPSQRQPSGENLRSPPRMGHDGAGDAGADTPQFPLVSMHGADKEVGVAMQGGGTPEGASSPSRRQLSGVERAASNDVTPVEKFLARLELSK